MMTDNYSQSVEVEVSTSAKTMQWVGICLALASLGFVLLSAFYNWWLMFGFAALAIAGGVLIHFYNKTAKEYAYDFSQSRLRIVAKDVVNRQRVYVELLWNDAQNFEVMTDIFDPKRDLLCASKAYERGVWQIEFKLGAQSKRLLFAPDDYMIALIKEKTSNIDAKRA